MKFITTFILIFALVFPASIFAQEISPNSPVVLDLQKGQKAPFDGVLLNSAAAAKILTDKKFTPEECQIEIDFELAQQKAKLDLLLKSIELSLQAEKAKGALLFKIKDVEIDRLQNLAMERPNNYSEWWLAGGVIVGIVLSVSIFAVAIEIRDQ